MAKKLIEVALPLAEINDASAYDKLPGIGPHPKNIHHWWAPLPLPCARAVLFASLVDDPIDDPLFSGRPKEDQDQERERLFGIIRSLLKKKIHLHPDVFEKAHLEIKRCCGELMPLVVDPFCGGGSIPLEAQRLKLEAVGYDLNPIAVLIAKSKVDILPRFAGRPPVNPHSSFRINTTGNLIASTGIADDVRHYGKQILESIRETLGDYYPTIPLGEEYGKRSANVIAWLWARTVTCPNPKCRNVTPLVRSFWVANKDGKKVWINPLVDHQSSQITYKIVSGAGNPEPGTVTRKGATCLICSALNRSNPTPISFEHIRAEARNRRLGTHLIAIIADGGRGRVYLEPNDHHRSVHMGIVPPWKPDTPLLGKAAVNVPLYGMRTHGDLFTDRQLLALSNISDLIQGMHDTILQDALSAGMQMDGVHLRDGGTGAEAYAEAIALFLGFALGRCTDFNNALCRWKPSGEQLMQLFGRQAIPMIWDFAESNILGEKGVCWRTSFEIVADAIEVTTIDTPRSATVLQRDASRAPLPDRSLLVSTDPPYYDNIDYADLSDFFYVWLRRVAGSIYPDVVSTVLTPKEPELVATPYRFGGDQNAAREHFESGFMRTFESIRKQLDGRFPLTVYYAMKQTEEAETDDEFESGSNGNEAVTGWETLLVSLVSTGFQITSTWPVRASQQWRMVARGSNALASYIVLACRPRSENAPLATRREYIVRLRAELPEALRQLQKSNIAPVDLAQAAIGPGMAVFSQFSKVVETDGTSMSVRNALALINQVLDEVLAEQDSEYDPDTRWALAWFEQYAMNDGQYGDAETLSKSKNTSVQGLAEAGILHAKAGKVRLLDRDELNPKWDPATDKRVTVWEITQQLIHALDKKGEAAAAALLQKVGGLGEVARDLAYRLFTICERKGWAQEALAYNSLVVSWPQIKALASKTPPPAPGQVGMDI